MGGSRGSRVWMEAPSFSGSRPVLFSWLGVLARAGRPSSLSFVGRSSSARESAHPFRLSSTTRKGEQVPRRSARGPDTGRTRRIARPFCHDSARTSGPTGTTRRGKSQLPFSFHLGFCVNACGKAPVGDKIELYKCCRVFAFIRSYFFCIMFVACT